MEIISNVIKTVNGFDSIPFMGRWMKCETHENGTNDKGLLFIS